MSDDFFSDAPIEPAPKQEKMGLRLMLFLAVVAWLAVIGLYCIAAHWW